jgi:hypothetical protein
MSLHPDVERVALLGWCLLPASSRSRAACFAGATDAATCDLDQLERWAKEYPDCNWRVVLGPSRIWGLDVDNVAGHMHDGVQNWRILTLAHPPLPRHPLARSGGGGSFVVFAHRGERIVGDAGHPAPGIDPRRGRQSQTIPPSRHHRTGQPYRWLLPPWIATPPPAPAWLLKLVQPPPLPTFPTAPVTTDDAARTRLERALAAVTTAPNGARNHTLNVSAYQIGKLICAGLLSRQQAVDALYAAARQAGLDNGEARATIRSGIAAGVRAG